MTSVYIFFGIVLLLATVLIALILAKNIEDSNKWSRFFDNDLDDRDR